MKLLIVTSIREDLDNVNKIFEKAGISVFSVSETIGHKTVHPDYLPGNWFGSNGEGTDALFFFSFTDDDKATATLKLVKQHNIDNNTGFPVRAFITPVEAWSF
jgi:hypothetical protein